MAVAKLQTIPKNMKVVNTASGTYLQETTRRRSGYKVPAKTRARMRAAANKLHAPVLTGSWLGYNFFDAYTASKPYQGAEKFSKAGRELLANFTGIRIWDNKTVQWRWQDFLVGGGAGLGIWTINKIGIFKPANRILARAKIPVRIK